MAIDYTKEIVDQQKGRDLDQLQRPHVGTSLMLLGESSDREAEVFSLGILIYPQTVWKFPKSWGSKSSIEIPSGNLT